MNDQELNLRMLLVDVGDRLSNENRLKLSFLLKGDVPTRELEAIMRDSRQPMDRVWEELINRQRITPNNINYLIDRMEMIQRLDIVRLLKKHVLNHQINENPLPENPVADLFERTEPCT
jgi:hypothetical protein